jgi:hypothetical protein
VCSISPLLDSSDFNLCILAPVTFVTAGYSAMEYFVISSAMLESGAL